MDGSSDRGTFSTVTPLFHTLGSMSLLQGLDAGQKEADFAV